MDPNEARRSKTGQYRTTPLRGVATHPPYFHDGSAATLEDAVTLMANGGVANPFLDKTNLEKRNLTPAAPNTRTSSTSAL